MSSQRLRSTNRDACEPICACAYEVWCCHERHFPRRGGDSAGVFDQRDRSLTIIQSEELLYSTWSDTLGTRHLLRHRVIVYRVQSYQSADFGNSRYAKTIPVLECHSRIFYRHSITSIRHNFNFSLVNRRGCLPMLSTGLAVSLT